MSEYQPFWKLNNLRGVIKKVYGKKGGIADLSYAALFFAGVAMTAALAFEQWYTAAFIAVLIASIVCAVSGLIFLTKGIIGVVEMTRVKLVFFKDSILVRRNGFVSIKSGELVDYRMQKDILKYRSSGNHMRVPLLSGTLTLETAHETISVTVSDIDRCDALLREFKNGGDVEKANDAFFDAPFDTLVKHAHNIAISAIALFASIIGSLMINPKIASYIGIAIILLLFGGALFIIIKFGIDEFKQANNDYTVLKEGVTEIKRGKITIPAALKLSYEKTLIKRLRNRLLEMIAPFLMACGITVGIVFLILAGGTEATLFAVFMFALAALFFYGFFSALYALIKFSIVIRFGNDDTAELVKATNIAGKFTLTAKIRDDRNQIKTKKSPQIYTQPEALQAEEMRSCLAIKRFGSAFVAYLDKSHFTPND